MDIKKFLDDFLNTYQKNLTNKQDIEYFFELASNDIFFDKLKKLAFDGKFIYGLFNNLQTKNPNYSLDAQERLQQEFKNAILNFTKSLEEYISHLNDFHKKILTQKYITPSKDTIPNLISFCKDLNYLKIYFNDMKIK
ncbi:MAG TPA: hypothetical protein PK591_02530 [Ignavibacteriales bacterium]|nr:hypothetical protein [Ignavibacteriales bacterium]